mgnify:CR=1 FL=1
MKKLTKKVSVSVLSSKNLESDLIKLNSLPSVDYIHIDVMDGKFVRNKNNPFKTLYKMSNVLTKRLDVHLMVRNPLKDINYYAALNTEYITVHSELEKVDKYLDLIKEYGIKCGLAVNPETDISLIMPYLSKVDLILIMSVHPGKGGQEFIDDTTKKILKLKKILVSKRLNVKIEVDGGVNDKTISRAYFADILVSGSYVLSGETIEGINDKVNLLKSKE